MRFFILATLLLVAVSASPLQEQTAQFQAFKLKHNKVYENQAEEATRFGVFLQRLAEIEEHNALYDQGLVSYTKGVNQFTDWTDEERKAYLNLYPRPAAPLNRTRYVKSGIALPSSVDLRTEGLVTAVKNQGDCGACWAFSVTGTVEGIYAKKTGTLVSFSEQQLIDCSKPINGGCDGGYIAQTFPYISENGIEAESDYTYNAKDGACVYEASKVVTKVSDYVWFNRDEETLAEAVYSKGPVGVAIDADYIFDYASGVFSDTRCTQNQLNHAVLVVGYGIENGQDYWIVKNSWGDGYGEAGYIRFLRGTNQCGIAEDDSYPVIN